MRKKERKYGRERERARSNGTNSDGILCIAVRKPSRRLTGKRTAKKRERERERDQKRKRSEEQEKRMRKRLCCIDSRKNP